MHQVSLWEIYSNTKPESDKFVIIDGIRCGQVSKIGKYFDYLTFIVFVVSVLRCTDGKYYIRYKAVDKNSTWKSGEVESSITDIEMTGYRLR